MSNHNDKLYKYLQVNNGVLYAQCNIYVNASPLLSNLLFLIREVQITAVINGTIYHYHALYYYQAQGKTLINTSDEIYQLCCHVKFNLLMILTQMEISMQSACNGTCESLSYTVKLTSINYLYTNMLRINTREISVQCLIITTHTGDQSYQCSNCQMILM